MNKEKIPCRFFIKIRPLFASQKADKYSI